MRQRGLTLIELIIVMVILGAVSTGIASFVRSSIDNVVLINDRDKLLSASRFAVERVRRELVNAVPNSVRVYSDTDFQCVQFVPIDWVSVYLDLPVDTTSVGDLQIITPLSFDNDVFTLQSGVHEAIVYPLHNNDVYSSANNKRVGIATVPSYNSSDETITLSVDNGFVEHSPASRVYFASEQVSFCVVENVLNESSLQRVSQTIGTGLPSAVPSGAITIAERLQNNLLVDEDLPFRFVEATRLRNASVQVRFRFSQNDEAITLQQEVHLPNAP